MKTKVRFWAKSILLLGLGVLIGTLLLVVAYQFPVHTTNKIVASELAPKGGEYPRASELGSPYVNYFDSFYPDVLDGGTDAVMLSTALDESAGNALVRAMTTHSEYRGDYCYYWHGYVSILRPLMRVFGLSELRIFNGLLQCLLMFACAKLIVGKKGRGYGAMFVCSCVFLMPTAITMSLQFSWIFYITFLGILGILLRGKELAEGNKYLYYFIVLGMCTSYLDLLTYPLVTWGMPLVWMLVLDETPRKAADWVKRVVNTGLAWIFGYAGMWIMKWVLASLVLGRNVVQLAIDEIFLRSGAVAEESYGLWERLNAIYVNWRHYQYPIYFVILAGWICWWIYRRIVQGDWKYDAKKYAYCLIGVSSFVWYVVLANHTTIHHFFTYRIFGVTLLAGMALMLESVTIQNITLKHRLRFTGVILCGMVLAALLSMTAREELYVTNGHVEFVTAQLQENESIEFSFTPAYNQISKLGLGLQSDAAEGEYLITLWDGETQVYNESYSIAKSNGSHYCEINVSWDLEKGKVYRMTIEAEGNSEPVFVWLTKDAAKALDECGMFNMASEEEGQFLMGITYLSYPRSLMRLVFLTVSWFGMFMVFQMVISSCLEKTVFT